MNNETVFAQQRTISGTVRDVESGETLPYASVLAVGTTLGAATNVDGYFVLIGVPADSLTLRVTYLGYQTTLIRIDARTQNTPLLIEMTPAATELDEVLVTAESYQMMKTAENVSQVTVSPKDIAVLPNIGEVDIFRSLQLLPGISGTNEGSSGLFVRGGTPDQNLVLLDGMTVYHVDHFFGFFSAFNADAIKDVQVYKGGFPAQYGGRTSSVVDLAGKTGDANNFQLGAGLNLLSSNAVIQVPLGGRGSFLLSARRSYTDIIQTGLYTSIYETVTGEDITEDTQQGFGGAVQPQNPNNPLQASVQPDFYFYDLNAKLTYRPSNKDVLALSLYNGQDHLDKSRDDSQRIGGGDVNTTLNTDIVDLTDWGNVGLSGKWSRQWTPRLYSNALVAYSQYFSEYDRSAFIERLDEEADTASFTANFGTLEDNRVDDLTLRLDNEWQMTRWNKVGFGVQVTRSDVRYDFVRDDTLTILDRDQSAQQAAVYVQNTVALFSRLDLSAGLRVAYYDVTAETYLEPRISVGLGVTDRIKLKGAYGQYNQFVARVVNENITEGARNFWLIADGDDVGVQASTHYILGTSYETATWLFDIEAYHKDLAGLTEFSLRYQSNATSALSGGTGIEADELFFTGDGTARGLEFLLQKKTGRHTGWISYTLSEVEHTFPDLNDGEPFPALHDQTNELKLINSLNLGRWTLAGTLTFATGKPYTTPESQYTITLLDGAEQSFIHVGEKNGERLPAYHRLDLSAHYKFDVGETSKLDVGLSIFNLYNRQNVWYTEFDLSQSPMVTTDVTFLGFTPNLSVRVDL